MARIISSRLLPHCRFCSRASWWLICVLLHIATLKAQPFNIDTIQWTGSADQRINVVFFGDGYMADELTQYASDVKNVVDHFFTQSPFREYRAYFNIVAFEIPSNVSGASRDPSMPIDNYFGSSYNTSNIERLLAATRTSRAQEILFNQFPLYSQAVLIVNDAKYGGSGGWLATTSVHPDASEIALHEIGHSFAALSDEYWAGDNFARESPNMTQENDPDLVRWKNWLGYRQVNIYPHTGQPTWFKPHEGCKMQVLNASFCAVCRETITKVIHNQVNPTLGFAPDVDTLVFHPEDTVNFALDLLVPDPNTFDLGWMLAGVPVGNLPSLILQSHDLAVGWQDLEVYYYDSTDFVRDSEHTSEHSYILDWHLLGDEATDVQVLNTVSPTVFPNPARDFLYVEDARTITHYSILDLVGRVWSRESGKARTAIDVTHLPVGAYILTLQTESGRFPFHFIKQ